MRRSVWLAIAFAVWPSPVAQAVLTHKYTFNDGTANDSVATTPAHGTLTGGASITLGGQLALDSVNDYLSLPGATIAINGYVDATFEGWFTLSATRSWQRLFDFGDTNGNGAGADYIFYTPTSGGGDNRAALTNSNPGSGNEDIAFAGAVLSNSVQHHVAVVVDESGANTMSVYVDGALATGAVNPVALTRSLSGLSNVSAYIGKSAYNADPFFSGAVDEFRIYNNALSAAQVAADFQAGPEPPNALAINVSTTTGAITLRNVSSSALSFDQYQISSAGGKLKFANGSWNSLDDQNIDAIGANPGQSWDESGGSSPNVLAELFLAGSSTLQPGGSIGLGNAFNTTMGSGDLKFQFTLTTGELIAGKVNYVADSGDFNADGHTDGADFLIWQRNLGATSATLAQGDADGNGTVNGADLTVWNTFFGAAVPAADAGAGVVPEPRSLVIAGVGLLAAVGLKRRSSTLRKNGRPD